MMFSYLKVDIVFVSSASFLVSVFVNKVDVKIKLTCCCSLLVFLASYMSLKAGKIVLGLTTVFKFAIFVFF